MCRTAAGGHPMSEAGSFSSTEAPSFQKPARRPGGRPKMYMGWHVCSSTEPHGPSCGQQEEGDAPVGGRVVCEASEVINVRGGCEPEEADNAHHERVEGEPP